MEQLIPVRWREVFGMRFAVRIFPDINVVNIPVRWKRQSGEVEITSPDLGNHRAAEPPDV